MRAVWRSYRKDESGAGAIEFVLVLIPFLALVFGIINVSMMYYANHTLQYAAEDAARCYSIGSLVNSTTCNSAANAVTYAGTRYSGPNISPVFSASVTACGHTVTGTANYPLNVVLFNMSVPLSATACFP